MVVLGGEFILLLFIGDMAGCWSELRGGSSGRFIIEINWGHLVGCFTEGLLREVLL